MIPSLSQQSVSQTSKLIEGLHTKIFYEKLTMKLKLADSQHVFKYFNTT